MITVHEPYVRELRREGHRRDKAARRHECRRSGSLASRTTRFRRSTFRVAYHGAITPWYGVDLIVDALASISNELADFEFHLVGDGDALADVLRAADELGLSPHVHASKRVVPRSVALSLVAGASVGVVPNLPNDLNRFALPTKLFEYIALGVPVVAARLPTLGEYFTSDEVHFFEPGSSGDLARALMETVQNPDEAMARSRAALARIADYAWPISKARYVALLASLAARSPHPQGD